jgi:putative ABC transport system permease protein
MLRNYIIIGLRNIQRNPFYFATNLAGLSIGITCCFLTMLFVQHELSYDQFHAKKERIFRMNYDIVMGGNEIVSPSVPVFVAPHLKKLLPEIEDATRFLAASNPMAVHYGGEMYDEKGFAWADSNFFNVFDFKIIKGNKQTALSKPKTLVISKSLAKKYFGDEDPLGKILVVGNNIAYEVTAVMEDVPANSHFTFDFVTSIYSQEGIDDEKIEWNNPNYSTFLLVKPGASVADLQSKVNNWVNPPDQKHSSGGNTLNLQLEPLNKVHFNTTVFNFQGKLAITDTKYLFIFSAIAFLLLIIACINYINLSTARAATRAKEIGIRKTAGADFRNLIFQFLFESFFVLLPSVMISLLATRLFIPSLNFLLDKQIQFEFFTLRFLILVVTGSALLTLLAGFYPALVLSRFRPIASLKANVASGSGVTLRKVLVIAQFTISAILIIATLVVFSQLQFMRSKKLGLDKEHVLIIRGNRDLKPKLNTFIQKIKSLNGVESACATWRSPFETVVGNGFNLSANPGNEGWVTVGGIAADQDYIKTANLQLLAGRNFDPSKINDTINEFIVNEAFLRDFGLTADEAIGKQATLGMVSNDGPGTIVGVVKDFHITSLHEVIRPVVLFNHPDYVSGTLVRLSAGDMERTINAIKNEWKQFVPQRPFNYTFLDDQYDSMYRTEQRVSNLAGIFSGIAVFVGCLGLLALASFTSFQRAKEISIRRVLGSTSLGIIVLLSKGYLRLMLIAFLVATPISYFLLTNWLANFAFKVNVGPGYYFIALFTLAFLSFLTVGYQSFKASIANPTENLRRE